MVERIILASGSPRRKELLLKLEIPFEVIVSEADESIKEQDPEKVVLELSKRKALAVLSEHKLKCANAVILGADTVVALDGAILGKPKDEADAKRMLTMLSGREHQVYTGVTLIRDNGQTELAQSAVCTKVRVEKLTEEEIDAYIATKDPMDKAGAYGIQNGFAKHIRSIDGDYNNVVGLPVSAVYGMLKQF